MRLEAKNQDIVCQKLQRSLQGARLNYRRNLADIFETHGVMSLPQHDAYMHEQFLDAPSPPPPGSCHSLWTVSSEPTPPRTHEKKKRKILHYSPITSFLRHIGSRMQCDAVRRLQPIKELATLRKSISVL